MKSLFAVLVLFLVVALAVCDSKTYADDTLDGIWNVHIEVVKGVNKGLKADYKLSLTQEISSGRIDGSTIDESGKQIGRASGLIKRTIIELAFSFENDRAMATMHWSPDGTMMGGIFRLRNGGEGVVYAIKDQKE